MTSGRINRGVYIECDGIGCHETLEGSSFDSVWNEARVDGWESRKIMDEWFNYCPSCKPQGGKLNVSKLMGGK